MQTTIATLFSIPLLMINVSATAADSESRSADSVEVLTVSGTRTDREINEIAANVTRISRDRIDTMASSNIRDILRYEPGVSVEGNGRFGLSGFNIRGINGDRVLILLDNVPIADEFSFGPNLNAGRDFVDIDLIDSVDIVRGPASTLYGSDAIGGVVAFTSKTPEQLVQGSDKPFNRLKLGYDSQSNQKNAHFTHAGVNGKWQWLFSAGYRNGNEVESFYTNDDRTGSDRTSANDQSNDSQNLMARIYYSPRDDQRLSLSLDTNQTQAQTNLLSDVGVPVRGTLTLDSTGDDEQTRERVLLNYRWEPVDHWLTRMQIDAFLQSSDTEQKTFFRRAPLSDLTATNTRHRESFFQQDNRGINVQLDQTFDLAGEHYLIYGIQWQSTESESLRTGSTVDDTSGVLLPEFSPFPTRDFPKSRLTESAVFIQDEYQLLDGALRLSPGLRYDRFSLTPTSDEIFTSANPGVEVAAYDDSQLSKKLGAVYNVSPTYTLWAQYAEGFRIPPMDDVNVGFTNFLGGYTSLANPDLLPESVDSVEVGLRANYDALYINISAYQNDYTNFIESLAVVGFNRETNLLEFQARNLGEVEIKGIDAQAQWYVGETIVGADDWIVNFAGSWQSSENKQDGTPLDSIIPTQYVLGLQYRNSDDDWHVEVTATHSEDAKSFSAVENQFIAPSYTLIDVIGHYTVSDDLRINAGFYNLGDKEYWLASEVRGRTNDESLSRFTAPGRTFAANLIYTF